MTHSCTSGCAHWCSRSPTKRHQWVIETNAKPASRGHCRICGKARKFGGGVGTHITTPAEVNAQVGANACVMVLGDIAVEAEDLQIGRESFSFDSHVEAISSIVRVSAMLCAVIVGVIQRQEGRVGLTTAGALTAVMSQDGLLQFLRALAQVMITAQPQRLARTVTIRNTAWAGWGAAG